MIQVVTLGEPVRSQVVVVQINQYLHPMNENDIHHTISSYVHSNLPFCY